MALAPAKSIVDLASNEGFAMTVQLERSPVRAPAPEPVDAAVKGSVTAAIAVSGLVKDFGATRALDHLDLTVQTGEVHGFLGPNGAGKTTTIRVLLGLLRRDDGDVTVLGGDPWRDAVALHRRLAYVPGEVNLWPNLTGGEVIDLLGDAARRPRSGPARRAARALPARPDQEVPRLLQGQPAEGRARGGVRLRRRAVPAGRADAPVSTR